MACFSVLLLSFPNKEIEKKKERSKRFWSNGICCHPATDQQSNKFFPFVRFSLFIPFISLSFLFISSCSSLLQLFRLLFLFAFFLLFDLLFLSSFFFVLLRKFSLFPFCSFCLFSVFNFFKVMLLCSQLLYTLRKSEEFTPLLNSLSLDRVCEKHKEKNKKKTKKRKREKPRVKRKEQPGKKTFPFFFDSYFPFCFQFFHFLSFVVFTF